MRAGSFRGYLIAYMLMTLLITACAPVTNTVVTLSRDRYTPKLNLDDYKIYNDKTILLSSIEDKSGTPNMWYYNPDKTVGYQLFYASSSSINQPVVSFFWYALQKGFEHTRINIVTTGPVYNIELSITFTSLSDKEVQFDVVASKRGRLLYNRHHIVRTQDMQTTDTTVLENRAYEMIDAMVKAILDDPEFRKIFA